MEFWIGFLKNEPSKIMVFNAKDIFWIKKIIGFKKITWIGDKNFITNKAKYLLREKNITPNRLESISINIS